MFVQKRAIAGFLLVAILIAGGVTVYFIFPTIQQQKIRQLMVLSEKNAIVKLWRDVPMPIRFEINLFNLTNAADVQFGGAKPRFQEIGPFIFREKRQKVNVTWNDHNSTVSYRQVVKFFYVEGNLDQNITTINVPLLVFAKKVKKADGFIKMTATILLKKSQLFITRTIREILFEGYEDALIKMANKLNLLPVKTEKFGWFLMKNNSNNGLFNVYTGESAMKDFTVIDKWNTLSNTTFFEAPCNKIEGTTGEMWPPYQFGENLTLFVTDVCRTLKLNFQESSMMHDINVRKYAATERLFDTGVLDENNKCFCREQCLPRGAIDVSICNHGSPIVVSMPHFTLADPVYLENVEGLTPDPKKYPAFIYLQPEMGMIVYGSSRFQINILLQPDKKLSHFAKMNKTIVFPVLWFNETAQMSPKLVEKLQNTTQNLPYYAKLAAIVLIVAGVLVLGGLLVLMRNRTRNGAWCAFTGGKKTVQYPAVHFAKIGNGEKEKEKHEKDISINKV